MEHKEVKRVTPESVLKDIIFIFQSLNNYNSKKYFLFEKKEALQVLFVLNWFLNESGLSKRINLYLNVSFWTNDESIVAIQILNKPFGYNTGSIVYHSDTEKLKNDFICKNELNINFKNIMDDIK